MILFIMETATSPLELQRSYTPDTHEPAILAKWDEAGAFRAGADPDDHRLAYCIVIPPPNVTAALHLGHALNNTLQDILIRFHRMKGMNVLWMPGTDHAGIATQSVVEKRLLAEGRRRTDFSREEFIRRVRIWKDEYEATITGQLRTLGASCDWSRQRFTMDDICARAVRVGFLRLFREGLIYRGKRLVNWDPVTRTALADDEVEMREVDGFFWYLRYPVVDDDGRDTGDHVTVATTRPETMLGDTAVAVHPDDRDRRHLIGRRLRLPIVDRLIPIVGDDYVVQPDPASADPKAQFASGFLKVTPAHDPNDWEIGRRHDLEVINIMGPDGSISDRHGWESLTPEAQSFVGLTREEARAKIVQWFDAHGLLAETRPYRHAVGHSYRSHVPIEPWLSDQWYVRVSDDRLVGEAQRALDPEQFAGTPPARMHGGRGAEAFDGTLRFFPARYARSYQAWHEGLRDWCISRQIWWGHRIPVWTIGPVADAASVAARWQDIAARFPDTIAVQVEESPAGRLVHLCIDTHASTGSPSQLRAEAEAEGFRQDDDVLDTWFSSGLWPISTLGWPDPDADPQTKGLLDRFNPGAVLCTGRDIITLWVSRMVMFNRFFRDGMPPFRDVYINPMIQDGHGQRMSKSLGNGVDPRDIISTHGADALRFVLGQLASGTQDVRLPVEILSPFSGRTFAPSEITSPEGYRVAAPVQTCPDTGKEMASGYGAAAGLVTVTPELPLARNTSARFDAGRNFCNKLWNATRFAHSILCDAPPSGPAAVDPAARPLVDRWILSRLAETSCAIEQYLAAYQFHLYAEAVYDFIWRDVCDWYLEAVKPTVRHDAVQRQILLTVTAAHLRLLHPLCPFVTEALFPAITALGEAGVPGLRIAGSPLLATASWPLLDDAQGSHLHDAEAQRAFARLQHLSNAIRGMRSRHQVAPRKQIRLALPSDLTSVLTDGRELLQSLCGISEIIPAESADRTGSVPIPFEGSEVLLLDLVDTVDVETERARLANVLADAERALNGYRAKLANEGYVRNAPPNVVEETRRRARDAQAEMESAGKALAALDDTPTDH